MKRAMVTDAVSVSSPQLKLDLLVPMTSTAALLTVASETIFLSSA